MSKIAGLLTKLGDAESKYVEARVQFVKELKQSDVDTLRQFLNDSKSRYTTLIVLLGLDDFYKKSLMKELIYYCSYGNANISLSREVIKSIDHKWLRQNIKSFYDAVLIGSSDEEYRRLAELLIELKMPQFLLKEIVDKALASLDEDIREVGEDFEDKLSVL